MIPGEGSPEVIVLSTFPAVVITTRRGGESDPPFDSLNLSTAVGDRPEAVAANRASVSSVLGISAPWGLARQVHGSTVLEVDREHAGAEAAEEADALVTTAEDLPIAVLVADCVPIALSSGSVIAAVHAGWRGLCAGVVEAAVASVRRSAGDPAAHVQAWVGPAIGPCHYEVGPDVPQEFARTHPSAPDFSGWADGSLRFDLRRAARWVLEARGVRVEREIAACTACDVRLFSHRRDGGVTGRQGLLVWRPTAGGNLPERSHPHHEL